MLSKKEKLISMILIVFVLIQMVLPFRHFLYPGYQSWHEQAHKFIWHMKLSHKKAFAKFTAYSPNMDKRHEINHKKFLSDWQYNSMVSKPRMILQFAHYLCELYRETGVEDIEVRVEAKTSLNARPLQYLVDPKVDLCKKKNTLENFDWIMPLKDSSLYSET